MEKEVLLFTREKVMQPFRIKLENGVHEVLLNNILAKLNCELLYHNDTESSYMLDSVEECQTVLAKARDKDIPVME